MKYLTYLNIRHFKGIENLELKDLSNINIIVGNNNCGKTSLLEAISILSNQNSIKSILNNVSKRDITYPSKYELFLEIFSRRQIKNKTIKIESTINNLNRSLEISGKVDDIKEFVGKISVDIEDKSIINKNIIVRENQYIKYIPEQDVIKIVYVTPYDHFREDVADYSIEDISKARKERVINLLKIFDKNILDFELIKISKKSNTKSIYINHKKYGLMPLFSFGDGIKKVFTLASAVVSAKGGILLVDEIETSVHKSMINEVFRWFIDACKEYEVQLICTTHSLEAIDGIITGAEDSLDLLSCFRIEEDEGTIYGTKFSGERLKDIRTFLGQDVR